MGIGQWNLNGFSTLRNTGHMLQLNETSETKTSTWTGFILIAESILYIVIFGELSSFTSAFCENVFF